MGLKVLGFRAFLSFGVVGLSGNLGCREQGGLKQLGASHSVGCRAPSRDLQS